MAKGFSLYMLKAIIGGRGDDLVDLARANLWEQRPCDPADGAAVATSAEPCKIREFHLFCWRPRLDSNQRPSA
jgi:hypothetical protein